MPSFYIVLAVALITAFILQFVFQMIQMKSFQKYYGALRKKGRVAIGKAKGGFHAGAIVMFAIDSDGTILQGCYMRGFTMLARFKSWDKFLGENVGLIKEDECKILGVSLKRAVMNAVSNYNTITTGGEIVEKQSLFNRIGDRIYGVNKKSA